MSKNAIVIFYDGCVPPQSLIAHIGQHIVNACSASEDSMVVKHYDEESIINITSEDALRKIVFGKENEQQQEMGTVKVCFSSGQSKLQVVKFIKEKFGYSLKEAKDIVDEGVITLAITTDAYQFVRDLSANGGCIIDGGDEHYAVAQAAVFINGKYPGNLQAENLVKDFAMARYHDTVNAADDIEKALLNTVRIVKEHPHIAQQWINSDLVKTITML
jgi:ribosomal protein L7/L12